MARITRFPSPDDQNTNPKYLTVLALTKYIKKKLDMDTHLQSIFVRGEISNFKHHSSGHMYLTIKDEKARIQAVMFQGDNKRLRFNPENGMKVLIQGKVSVFEAFGQYQLYIHEMEPDGIGALFLQLEQLKKQLTKEGLFEEADKKAISSFPEHIAIITSPTGAAIRDMITTIKRRFPIVQISVFPVQVQGQGAEDTITAAINQVNHYPEKIDTILLGRGGGSIEDLWSFNMEAVIRAVHESSIPIISGVGHETDTTLTDFAADLRAATPTGAAELAVPSISELHYNVDQSRLHLKRLMQHKVAQQKERLHSIQRSYAFQKPKLFIQEKMQYMDRLKEASQRELSLTFSQKQEQNKQLQQRLGQTHPKRKLTQAREQMENLTSALTKNHQNTLQQKRQQLQSMLDKLALLNPLYIMNKGFSIVYKEDKSIVKQINQVQIDENIDIAVTDGVLACTITGSRRDEDE
ncbi:MAG TPA: exodeoxyribonuclease VII large subunit [Pseudogracilibacillus sp.]|nr:exodeoxyribonuclease VII large subunit [Pseudogracilibacillus sp.]